MNIISTRQYTLRSDTSNLLPKTSVLLYGTDPVRMQRSLPGLAAQTHDSFEVILLHDGPLLPSFLTVSRWPRRVRLSLVTADTPCGPAKLLSAAEHAVRGEEALVLQEGDRLDPDELSKMSRKLEGAPAATVGVYGDLEVWEGTDRQQRFMRTLKGEPSPSRRKLLQRLARQPGLAPPLVRMSAWRRAGGYGADYPGEGFLQSDSAFLLSLLGEGRLQYDPNLYVRRTLPPQSKARLQDERMVLNVLLRQASRRLGLS